MVGSNICTGCSACAAVCEKKAIRMERDSEGFLQPRIDKNSCVTCGRCEKVCPVTNPPVSEAIQVAAVRSKDSALVECSSSGGMFSMLAEQILSLGGIVFGCAMQDARHAVHMGIERKDELDRLRRSKYVQSDKKAVFEEIKQILNSQRQVMFVGTPCEVAGLCSYLGKHYDNLLAVDFICHGVPSPMAWEKYVDAQEQKNKSAVMSINFRSKKLGWRNYSMKLKFENGSETSAVLTQDEYLRGFLCDLYLRKSCYNCQFKGNSYASDITIGDFFAVNRVLGEIDHDEGTSLVIAHNTKGESVLTKCNCFYWKLDDGYLEFNEAYSFSPKRNYWREKALKEMHNKEFSTVVEKYCGRSVFAKIRRKIAHLAVK